MSLGEVGLFIDHEYQVLNHVGDAFNRFPARLRGAKFHQRQIVVCPRITSVEFPRPLQFLGCFIEFLSVHAGPGHGAVRDDVVPFGIGNDRRKILLALLAALGQTQHHFGHQRLCLRDCHIKDTGADVERSQRSRELGQLAPRGTARP